MTTHQKQEEGRRTTTKSERTSASSFTNATAEHKKIIDAEEQQKSDDQRLAVTCRMAGSEHIIFIIRRAQLEDQFAMIAETAARVARSLLIRAADARKIPLEMFSESSIGIYIRFDSPDKPEEENVQN